MRHVPSRYGIASNALDGLFACRDGRHDARPQTQGIEQSTVEEAASLDLVEFVRCKADQCAEVVFSNSEKNPWPRLRLEGRLRNENSAEFPRKISAHVASVFYLSPLHFLPSVFGRLS